MPISSNLSVNQICSLINKCFVHNFINTLHVVTFTVNSTVILISKRNVYRYDYYVSATMMNSGLLATRCPKTETGLFDRVLGLGIRDGILLRHQ